MVDIEVKHPMFHFSKDEVVEILAEYNRTIDNSMVDVNCIKEWIQTQPHLTQIPEDRLVLNLLIRNKFSIEKTKKNIDCYYSIRAIIPEVYGDCYPSSAKIQNMRKVLRTFALPRLHNLNRILFFVLDEIHLKYEGYDSVSKICMDLEGLIYRNFSSSIEIVFDFTDSNLHFWAKWTPMVLKAHMTAVENVYSSRCSAIRIIGLPKMGQAVITAALTYLPQKIRARVVMHSARDEIAAIYPKDEVPLEFGGNGPPFRDLAAQYEDLLDNCEDYFRGIQNFYVDDKMRPSKLKNDDLLGYYGNFRKLDVD